MSNKANILNIFFSLVKMFLIALGPDKLFKKRFLFFRNISKTVRDIEKKLWNQICRASSFITTKVLCFFFEIFKAFWDKCFQRIAKNTPSPNYRDILVRLYLLVEVLDWRPIATCTETFVQIGDFVRKISTNKLFRTNIQPPHTHNPVFLTFQC